MKDKLRFAPLIRVSTERQERKGESLETQRKQLQTAIDYLGGTVYRWYAGQEHATVDQERKILEQLMEDAQAKRFDAVAVCDTSRWSRDNGKSKQYLDILKRHGIKFYVATREYSLYDPFQSFMLGMGVEVAEFFAKEQAYKSLINRIERAKKGYPASGKKPFGRVFNKETGQWLVVEQAKRKIQQIAKLYLKKDIQFEELGKKFNMSGSGIYKILTGRCGSKWVQKFHSESLGIDTAVETEIPPLLDAETIAQIKTKSAGRRIWDHNRSLKHDYLLSRMIFDHESGYALTGVTLRNTRYYRCYGQYRRGNGCIGINARLLEEALLESLFETLGSSEALQKAVFDGNPTSKVAETLRVKRSECLKELKAVEKKLANMVNAMADYGEDTGLFTQKVKEQIKTLEQQHGKLAFELDKINNDLRSLPTGQEVENLASQLLQRIKENYLTAGCAFQSLPFNEKRKILKLLFGGVDGNGKRFGVYVSSVTGGTKFEACGRLGAFDGWLDTRSGESYTEGLALKPDKETITAIGNVIKEDNPGLGCSEKLSFLCPYLIHQPHIGL